MREKAKTRKIRTNTYEVITPNKEKIITKNLKEFCKKYNLRYKSMLEVSSGRLKSHKKNWICKKL